MDIKEYRKIVEAIDGLELDKVVELEEIDPEFKFEYAFESITERSSAYKRRVSHA